jgi:hypothetical protein
VLLERTELLGPERLHLIQPRLHGRKTVRLQRVDPASRVSFEYIGGDETRRAQHLEVPAQRSCWHPDRVRKLAGPPRARPEKFHHAPPCRVGEGAQQLIKVIHNEA